MHGQIGGPSSRVDARGDLDFYYRTREALRDARRGLGGSTIDYDFFRARARKERARVRRKLLRPFGRFVRPLLAIAAIIAAIWMMPTHASDCVACQVQASHTRAEARVEPPLCGKFLN